MWLVVIPVAWILLGAGGLWAWNRFLASVPALDEPVPYWPAANPCTWCKPSPEGMCICAGECGHVNCVGDHTSMATLTEQDVQWLREQSTRGHE
jgi:hypothetical protein